MLKKGFTLLELLICVSLISVVMIFLFRLLHDVQNEGIMNTYLVDNQVNRNEIMKKINLIGEENGICGIEPTLGANDVLTVNVVLCNRKDLELTVKHNSFKIKYDGEVSNYKLETANAYYDTKNYEYEEITFDNFLFYRLTIRTQKKGSKSNNIDDIELFGTTNNSSFSCENKERIFVAPKAGYYKLEAWGAQGGSYNDTWHGGYGGYSTAIVNLEQGQKLYINVGCSPNKHQYPLTFVAGGYNGGGSAYSYDLGTQAGGGATTISYESGTLHSSYSTATFNNILLVAGGGGGAYYYEDEYSLGSNSVVGGNGGGEPKYNRYDGRRSLINDIRPSDGYVIANTYPEEACIKLYGTWENGTSCTLPYNATEETIQDPPNFPFRYADSTGSDVGRDYFTLVHHDGYTKTDYNVGSQCDTYYLSSNTLSHDSFGGGGGLIDGHFGCLSEAISSVNCDTGYNAPPSRAAICGALTGTQTTLTPSNEINSYFKPTAMYVEHYASAECGVVSGNQCINGCVRNSWAGCCGTGCTVADLTHVSAHTDVTYSKTRFAATGGSSYIKAGLINPSLTEKNEDDSSAMPTPGYMKKGNGYASVRFIGTTLS